MPVTSTKDKLTDMRYLLAWTVEGESYTLVEWIKSLAWIYQVYKYDRRISGEYRNTVNLATKRRTWNKSEYNFLCSYQNFLFSTLSGL